MKTKRTVPIRTQHGFLHVEVDALDCADVKATAALCMDGPANYRAMQLARKLAEDRAKWMPSAVYVICPHDIPVAKIGIGTDPGDRLCQIQIGCWHRLSVMALLWLDTGAYQIEQLALKAAKEMDIYLRGEWVSATPQEACELVVKAARYSRLPVYDSATWIENWSARVDAVVEARGRTSAIAKLRPRSGGKFAA